MSEYHVPVLFDEVMTALDVQPGKLYLDGTMGGGGHSEGIMARGGRLIAFDRDREAISESTKRFASGGYTDYKIVKTNFHDAKAVMEENGIIGLDGALLDLGISSHQIDEPQRGFSYRFDAKLDMRMDAESPLTAYDVVNEYTEKELSDVFFTYGEERFSKRIAAEIVKKRASKPIETTTELVEIIKKSTPEFYHRQGHPAKKVFQALRIEVNGELTGLKEAIEDIAEKLNSGARFAIITFHSLEDRIVKQVFKLMCTDCICDKSLPICVCGHKAIAKNIGKYKAGKAELAANSRSASATLRVIEKL